MAPLAPRLARHGWATHKDQQSPSHLAAGPQACATKQQSDCNQTTNVMHSGVCWCYCVRTVGVQPHSHQFIPILLCEIATRQPMCLHNDPLQPTRIEAHSSTTTPAFEYVLSSEGLMCTAKRKSTSKNIKQFRIRGSQIFKSTVGKAVPATHRISLEM